MYIIQTIERLGVPACSKVQNEKLSERSDASAKAHSFSPDQELIGLLAPLAVGLLAYGMACCPSCLRLSS